MWSQQHRAGGLVVATPKESGFLVVATKNPTDAASINFNGTGVRPLTSALLFVAESINFNDTGVWSHLLTTALLFVAKSINFNGTGIWSRLLTTAAWVVVVVAGLAKNKQPSQRFGNYYLRKSKTEIKRKLNRKRNRKRKQNR